MRMSEALCIATGLVRDRVTLSQMAELGDGRDVMLGKFGYKADLCAHGMARNAADLAYFLLENWGRPVEFHRPDDAPHEITDRTGLLAFIDIDGVREKGHVDLWDGSACFGKAYWTCRKVFWWKLD